MTPRPPVFSTNEQGAQASAGTPAAEVAIDIALVRRLLREQHPDLQDMAIVPMASGWDNMMFRLGDTLALRLPRRAVAAPLIENEQRWLPQLAAHLPLPIPAPVRIGAPSDEYPWQWSVLPWLPGNALDLADLRDGQGAALARFLRALHAIKSPLPAHAPHNPYRGVPIKERVAAIEERVARVAAKTALITPALRDIWARAIAAPMHAELVDVEPCWLHGDLHSRNVLVANGRFSAVIDWGDIAQGDCATDLAAVWSLLPDIAARAEAIQLYAAASAATWQRARGWAFMFGVTLLDAGLVNDARLAAAGAATLQRLCDGPA